LPETFLILRKTERDIIKNLRKSSCKVACFSRQILIKPEFFRDRFSEKNVLISNFIKIRPSAGRRTDWRMDIRTDMTTLTAAFRNFTNAPKISVTAFF